MDNRSENRQIPTRDLFLDGWVSVTGTVEYMSLLLGTANSIDDLIDVLEDSAETVFGPSVYLKFIVNPDNMLKNDVYRHYGADLARRFMRDRDCDLMSITNEVADHLIRNYVNYPPFSMSIEGSSTMQHDVNESCRMEIRKLLLEGRSTILRSNIYNKETMLKALEDLPDGQGIHYQVVSASGQVWNVGADLLIRPNADFSIVRLSHPRLETYDNDDLKRIVSAANLVWDDYDKTTRIVLGCRHFDAIMQSQFDVLIREGRCDEHSVRDSMRGFVDNKGYFHDCIQAMVIAKAAGQIRNPNIGNGDFMGDELFSEHLY